MMGDDAKISIDIVYYISPSPVCPTEETISFRFDDTSHMDL